MRNITRQFEVRAQDGKLICIECKATEKSALRIAASIYGGGSVQEKILDGSGYAVIGRHWNVAPNR